MSSASEYEQLAIVYDVGFDGRMVKKKKNKITVGITAIKHKTSKDIDNPKNIKISKHTTIFKL